MDIILRDIILPQTIILHDIILPPPSFYPVTAIILPDIILHTAIILRYDVRRGKKPTFGAIIVRKVGRCTDIILLQISVVPPTCAIILRFSAIILLLRVVLVPPSFFVFVPSFFF